MRVLMVNAFHYLRGGVERTYFDETRWLEAAGHEVAHLATRDPRNLPSPTAERFAPGADFGAEATTLDRLALLPRTVWSAPAARCAATLAREFRPEIAHVHAPSRYLTPSVLRALERSGVPLVMTLHDFKPWCTNRVLFARDEPCERCRGGRHWHALATGCVQGSRTRSAVAAVEAWVHDVVGAYRAVRRWIAPSRFMLEKAVELGADRARVRLVPHGVEPPTGPAGEAAGRPPGRYVLFAGRLSVEKGVRLLPALAARIAPVPLVVAGGGPLEDWLMGTVVLAPNLRPLGHRDAAEVRALVKGAAVVIVPSLFYETYCYAAAEALLEGRPVVASGVGAIPELVEHEATGLLVPPGDAAALAAAVTRALADPAAPRWAEAGRVRVLEAAAPARHVERLTAVYGEALAG